MSDDLTLPDFLDRKKNGIGPTTPEERRSAKAAKRDPGIVMPPKRDWSAIERARRAEATPLNGLTAGEQEELAEIRAMAKTNIDLAKSMASEWLGRTGVRSVQARRRSALQTVKNLYSHRRSK